MTIRSRRLAGFLLCLVVTSTLVAAPAVEMPSLFARFWAYVQSKLAPLIGTQSKISPLIGTQGRLSPPLPSPEPPSDTTEVTTTKIDPPQP